MWKFHEAWHFYDTNRSEIHRLRNEPDLGPIVRLLIAEEPLMETRRRNYWKHRIRYRLHSLRRRNRSGFEHTMFHIFELGGRTISELRDPTQGIRKKPKRVTQGICEALKDQFEPGDIIITRHHDALSNVFLPGFWPHGALYVGEQHRTGHVVEARKDGVKIRDIEDTLSVDAFLILRVQVAREFKLAAAQAALSHVGKLYDFAFDFRQSDRLACTAVIYRSWHGQAGIHFELGEESGRLCLSAENLISQALDSNGFDIFAYFGPSCEEISYKEEATARFQADRELFSPNPLRDANCDPNQ